MKGGIGGVQIISLHEESARAKNQDFGDRKVLDTGRGRLDSYDPDDVEKQTNSWLDDLDDLRGNSCVSELEIQGHGWSVYTGGFKPTNGIEVVGSGSLCKDKNPENVDRWNVIDFGVRISSRMCLPCTIKLTTCFTGDSPIPQQLADATGCTVKAFRKCIVIGPTFDQICNDPESYLGDKGNDGKRNGNVDDDVVIATPTPNVPPVYIAR